jgi:methylenetetrahydrofolate reductase (NADPH)
MKVIKKENQTEFISDLLDSCENTVSFEVYPPKKGQKKQFEIIKNTINRLKDLHPDFISVTYGPGGTNKGKAVDISEYIKQHDVKPLAHLTSVGYTKEDIPPLLEKLHSIGVKNILALRGDVPQNVNFPHGAWCDFRYAKDLISMIKKDGRFCIGAAAYPEGHPDCKELRISINHMKEKIEAGADFFISQMFFDNQIYFDFLDRVRDAGIHKPIIPGIMPVLRAKQINKILSLSDAYVPKKLTEVINLYSDNPQSMEAYGIEYALRQIDGLKRQGIRRFHIYSMNRWEQVTKIVKLAQLK